MIILQPVSCRLYNVIDWLAGFAFQSTFPYHQNLPARLLIHFPIEKVPLLVASDFVTSESFSGYFGTYMEPKFNAKFQGYRLQHETQFWVFTNKGYFIVSGTGSTLVTP